MLKFFFLRPFLHPPRQSVLKFGGLDFSFYVSSVRFGSKGLGLKVRA